MNKKLHLRSLVNSLSLVVIFSTALLEYFSELGILLTWGYMVGITLTAISGKKIHTIIALTVSLVFISSALFVFNVSSDMIIVRTYSVIGLCFITLLVILLIERRTKAEILKIQMLGIFSYGTQGIILTNQSGEIILVNSFIEHLFGYTQQELKSNNITLLVPDIILASSVRKSGLEPHILKPLIIEQQDLVAYRKDESTLPVEISLNDFDLDNKMYRVAFITDITVRKQNQYILEAQKKELEIVNKELESFSYSVSHDLRSPLRSVGGYAQMLEEDYAKDLNEDALRLLHNIDKSAKHMGLLIDDLLAFSRLGRKQVQKMLVNMTNLVNVSLTEINLSTKHHAEIVIEELHPAMADPSLMSVVMSNLLSNAIKYSAKSAQPKINISSVTENNSVTYCIRDNGVGFDMLYVHKLFGVFQRLHTEAEFEGTGVGLAIANRIIQKHGGKIWAESELGKGTCFYFSLPQSDEYINAIASPIAEHENF